MSVLIAQTPEDMANLMHVIELKKRFDDARNPVGILESVMRESGYGSEENEILAVNSVAIYTRGNPHPGTQLIINFQFIDDDREETDGNFFVRFDAAGKLIGDF